MTLFILDPSLESFHGHHMQWNMSIAVAAQAREQDVVIIANKSCTFSRVENVEIMPWFSHTCYAELSNDRITGEYDDFCKLNDEIAEELSLLPRERFRATDVIIAPTITEKHLLGYVSWMKTFDPALAPLFVVHLMFPSGLGAVDSKGKLIISNPLQALFYKLAFRVAYSAGPNINFFGSGRQLAREFSELLGLTIEPHPIPNCPKRRSLPPGSRDRPTALLFAGDAKVDKGFLLVPKLAHQLSQRHPNWDFVVHANSGSTWGEALSAYDELLRIADQRPNVSLKTSRLSHDEYIQLLETADCYVCSYDPAVYARKSSGVVWEAISLAMPMLVPTKTWLECEAKEWGAGYFGYANYSVSSIVKAFSVFQIQLPELYEKSAMAAKRYHAYNSSEALMNQIGALWAPRLMAASLTILPESSSLSIKDFNDGWHSVEDVGGRVARWTNKDFLVRFDWPSKTNWQVEFEVLNFIGSEQMTQAQASAGGRPATVEATLYGDTGAGGKLRVTGPGSERSASEVELRIELPWTYRPETDSRELGICVCRVKVSPCFEPNENTSDLFEITSPMQWSNDGQSFLLESVTSGIVKLDPVHSSEICFNILTDRPELARSVLFFVNGIPLPLEIAANGLDTWQASAICKPSVLSRRGYRTEWDLQLASDRKDALVWIAAMTVNTQQQVTAASVAPTLETALSSQYSASERLELGQIAAEPLLDNIRLNEHYVGGESYAHLDISLFGVTAEGEFWAEVRFKFCFSHNHHYMEFRNLPNWPQILALWPYATKDQFSPLIRIGDMHPIPREANRRDVLLIRTTASLLPRAIEAIARHADHSSLELTTWMTQAKRASRDWVDLSQDDGEPQAI